jgi:hypothetical protein
MTEGVCRSRFRPRGIARWAFASYVAIAALSPAATVGADEVDPVVGVWVGEVTQGDQPPFEIRMTLVSKNGGVTRYPSYECGGMLTGAKKANSYEYDETITWGGLDEETEDPCINGHLTLTVKGDKMTMDWSGTHDGEAIAASAQLKRESVKGKK